MSNLSSLISFSSATQGEKNYVTNPSGSSNTTGWAVVAGTGATTQATVAVARSTTASELPRATSTGTGLKFTSTAASGGTPVTAFAYTTFKLDAADLGKKLKVQFEMAPVSGYTASDYSIEVRASATAFTSPNRTSGTLLALSTDSSSVTSLPNATGTFRTTFDTQSALPYIAVYLVPKTTVAVSLVVSDFVVGPGVVTQGAAVSAWQNYTPTYVGFGTVVTNFAQWRRVGDSMELRASFLSGTVTGVPISVSLPTGYTGVASSSCVLSGNLEFDYTTTASGFVPIMDSAALTVIKFGTTSSRSVFNYIGGTNFGNGTTFTFTASVPIAEWASSAVVNIGSNDVEFAYNTDTATNSSNTSAFAYGPAGTTFVVISTSGTSHIDKRVRFTTPIQATDVVIMEAYDGSGWVPYVSRLGTFSTNDAGTTYYGVNLQPVGGTPTDIDVSFYSAIYPGTAWSAIGGSWKWRLRKERAGQAIGFSAATNTVRGLALDQRQYVVGTAYTNGTPTITCGQAGFAVTRGVLVPYQTSDGAWRMRLNVTASFTSASNGGLTLTFLGVTFKSVANFYQTVAASEIGNANAIHVQSYANPGLSTLSTSLQTAVTYSGVMLSGDVELDSKPTWAD